MTEGKSLRGVPPKADIESKGTNIHIKTNWVQETSVVNQKTSIL